VLALHVADTNADSSLQNGSHKQHFFIPPEFFHFFP
jgi:hypothetical protein